MVRLFVAIIGVAALLFNALLMLSDRAPDALQRVGGDAVRRLFERIDLGGRGADVLNDPRLPESDTIVHITVWAIAAVFVGWALWSWGFGGVLANVESLAALAGVFAAAHVVFCLVALGHLPRVARERQRAFEFAYGPMMAQYQHQLNQLRAQKALLEAETT